MTALRAQPPSPLSSKHSLIKMEERKRPLQDHSEAPPLKKQATSANGAGKSADSDAPWKEDLEKFQKDALLRQLSEYKRERKDLESSLSQLRKQARDHDDHIRTINAWIGQLIDEVKMQLPSESEEMDVDSLSSALHFHDQQEFQHYLNRHAKQIQSLINRLASRTDGFSPDVSDLQKRVVKLLAAEKEHVTELERLRSEVTDLDERLQNASLRYMVAEKKLDRARSITIAKFEKGLLLGAGGSKDGKDEASSGKKDEGMTNGTSEHEDTAELEQELKKTIAINDKQLAQIKKLEAESDELTTKITQLSVKAAVLSDDEYAKTELFKQLKAQHDDAIRKLNDMEALNTQLKEENARQQSDRTAYQAQLESESRSAVVEKDAALAQTSTDLARVRNHRDELLADQSVKKASLDERSESLKKLRDLQAVQEDRIAALESENERLRTHASTISNSSDIDSLSLDQLKSKLHGLETVCTNWQAQLVSMETAYHKAQKMAKQNVSEFTMLEEKTARLSAEKAKADQKYFAAMKSKETRDMEVRTLRMQSTKSSETMSQLREAEAASRSLIGNMEKQLVEIKTALNAKSNECRTMSNQSTIQAAEMARAKLQAEELKQLLVSKDAAVASTTSACRQAETEAEGLKAELASVKKTLESWKSKSGQSEQYEFLRSMAYCTVCKKELKDTVIKTCGHTFCHGCVEKVVQLRSRKCPNCGKPFGANDHMRITL